MYLFRITIFTILEQCSGRNIDTNIKPHEYLRSNVSSTLDNYKL